MCVVFKITHFKHTHFLKTYITSFIRFGYAVRGVTAYENGGNPHQTLKRNLKSSSALIVHWYLSKANIEEPVTLP